MSFTWYADAVSQGSELSWSVGSPQRRVDEIRLGFVASHVGLDSVFTGKMFARVEYRDAITNHQKLVTPDVNITMGDTSQPSKFTLQATIKLDNPVDIRSNTSIKLQLAPFPMTGVSSQTVGVNAKWFRVSYFLKGNEITA